MTFELDHLEVVLDGPFTRPDGGGFESFERLRSIPLARIHSTVREHVIAERHEEKAADGPVIVLALSDGLNESGDGSMRKPPSSDEIARLMRPVANGGLGLDRRGVAAHYARNLRTVDRWITRARNELPGELPPAKGQKPAPKASDAQRALETQKNGEPK